MRHSVIFGILLFGSIWGVLEATMGNILHFIGLWPLTGAIMTSIGIGLIAFTRSLYRTRYIGISMSIIAAAIKALDFIIPGSNVLRPMVAILAVGVAYEVIDALRLKQTDINKAITGVGTAYLSLAMFVFFTAYVMQFKFWLSKGFTGMLLYLLTDGWKFGLGSMFTYLLGSKLLDLLNTTNKQVFRSKIYYPAGTFIIIACWTIGLVL